MAPFRAAAGAPNFHVMANGGYSSASSASESEKDSDTESEDDVEPLSVVTYLDPAEKDSDSESEDDSLLMAVRSLLRTLSKKALMDIVAASRTEEAMPKTLTKEELAEFILQYGSFNVARREYGDQDKYLDALRNDLKLYNEIAREELRRINALRKVCYEQRRAEAVKLIDKAALMEHVQTYVGSRPLGLKLKVPAEFEAPAVAAVKEALLRLDSAISKAMSRGHAPAVAASKVHQLACRYQNEVVSQLANGRGGDAPHWREHGRIVWGSLSKMYLERLAGGPDPEPADVPELTKTGMETVYYVAGWAVYATRNSMTAKIGPVGCEGRRKGRWAR